MKIEAGKTSPVFYFRSWYSYAVIMKQIFRKRSALLCVFFPLKKPVRRGILTAQIGNRTSLYLSLYRFIINNNRTHPCQDTSLFSKKKGQLVSLQEIYNTSCVLEGVKFLSVEVCWNLKHRYVEELGIASQELGTVVSCQCKSTVLPHSTATLLKQARG